jgi:hypothetical protein
MACRDDVANFCSDKVPDRKRIVACLRAHRNELSVNCRTFMQAHVRRGR